MVNVDLSNINDLIKVDIGLEFSLCLTKTLIKQPNKLITDK